MFPKRCAPTTEGRSARRAIVVAGCLSVALAPAVAQAAPGIAVEPDACRVDRVAVGDVEQGRIRS